MLDVSTKDGCCNRMNTFGNLLRFINNVRADASITNEQVCRVKASFDLEKALVVLAPENGLPIGFIPVSISTSGAYVRMKAQLTDLLR